jgi:hypothetical protein
MKKVSFCTGAFLLVFLLTGVSMTQAVTYYEIPVFEALNGKWLEITWTVKGADTEAFTAVPEKFSRKFVAWGCAYWNPGYDWELYTGDEPDGFLRIDIYDEIQDNIGVGYMWRNAGTFDNWVGRLKMDMGEYGLYSAGTFSGKDNYISKGQYKSFGAYGYEWMSFAAFGGKVDIKVIADTAKKLPFTPPFTCGWSP